MNTKFKNTLLIATLALAASCIPKEEESLHELTVENGRIYLVVEAQRDTVMESASRILAQERIALRRYETDGDVGVAESGFVDIARYRDFDRELWDDYQRQVKFRWQASPNQGNTLLVCEPLYNPYEAVTHETDYSRLRLVPPVHPGFDIAVALTRRIAAWAEGRAAVSP